MDPISNVDRIVLILRQRLEERARASAKGAAGRPPARQEAPDSFGKVLDLAALDGAGEAQLARALVQSVLVEKFGPDLVNDARFQQVVDRVSLALDDDPASKALVARLVGELRAAAR
jgi:hypothetical protein